MKKISYLIILSISLFFKNAYSEDIYEGMHIEKVDIIVENQEDKNIPFKLKTQEGSNFSQFIFDEDLKELSKKYDKVYPLIKTKDERLFIYITLYKKPIINHLSFKGNSLYSKKKLQKELRLKKGRIFDKTKFKKGLTDIKELYIKKGYFDAEISYDIKKIDQNKIDIDITIKEGKSGKIQEIIFIGFTNKEKREIKKLLFSKKFNKFLSWFTKRGIFNKDMLDQDYVSIINYLNDEGYADATLDIELKQTKDKNLLIEIKANRGQLYKIKKVTFSGNKLLSDDEIEKAIFIHENDNFSPDKIRLSAESIKTLYGKDGYIETQVVQELYLSEKDNSYDVHFKIDESEQFKIGLIHIVGNKKTKSNVILRESLLTPGIVFDSRKLKATQRRLEGIGYFKDVKIYTATPKDFEDKKENYQDVYIEVEETTTGSGNLSFQLSQQNNLSLSLKLTERNFNIKGLSSLFTKEKFNLKGAGEYAQAEATLGKKQRNYLLSWVDPYFRDSLWRFGFELSKTYSELQTKNYKVYTYGGSLFTSYPITNFWTTGIKYRLRHSSTRIKYSTKKRIEEAELLKIQVAEFERTKHTLNPEDLKKQEEINQKNIRAIRQAEEDQQIKDNYGLISALAFSFGYDSTDRAYKAHRGLRSSFSTEFSGLGGDFYFFKINYLNTLYLPIWEKGTLKLIGNLRFLNPVGKTHRRDLPYSERFFLGGETSVRGYKPYSLGPKRPGEDDPLGGISSFLLSAEYCQEIIPRIDIFGFFDSGSISNEYFEVKKLNCSAGFGIRLEVMPRAPISIGYGFPLNPERSEDKQKFFYSFGGQF